MGYYAKDEDDPFSLTVTDANNVDCKSMEAKLTDDALHDKTKYQLYGNTIKTAGMVASDNSERGKLFKVITVVSLIVSYESNSLFRDKYEAVGKSGSRLTE